MRISNLAIIICLAAPWAAPAFAGDADFTLVNNTGYQIDSVFVGPHTSRSWGRDIMGRDSLSAGESVSITFPHGGKGCAYDIKVKYNDGDEAEWGDVDLCKFEKISLFWDGTNTHAVGE